MKLQKSAFSFAKIIVLMMSILVAVPYATQAQKRNSKKKVEHVSPSRHYANLPKRGARIQTAPRDARSIKYRNVSYRFHNGIFYKPNGTQFVVAAPPIGIRITALPAGYRTISIKNRRYLYHYGTYYIAVQNGYEVVSPPVGALVESIPDGFEELEIEGNTYYVLDGTQYKAVINRGEIWYEVIKVG